MAEDHVAPLRPGDGASDGLNDLLYLSKRTRVRRVGSTGRLGSAAICKEPLGADSLKRVRQEAMILERLAGTEGVSRLIGTAHDGTALMVAEADGITLAETIRLGPIPFPRLLTLAHRLASIVVAVHRRGVVHKDISPANILISGDQATLIDFELSTTVAEERPRFTHQSQITGTLAYLAPEQTGRTGRPVDQRADLYSLGATLYELATGQPPFGVGDALQLVHDHLTQVPASPVDLDPTLSTEFCEILLRLLQKEPDRRYQSAEGLAYDLGRLCSRPTGDTTSFTLGERDFPLRLTPPSGLVGRDTEIASLRKAFEDAVSGQRRGVLVTGPPGVGKTALIDELRTVATTGVGWFVTGKFDQYRRDAQANAVTQAMRGLGRLLLAEPEAELVILRPRIRRCLGFNVALIASVLPEFALLLDVAPAAGVPDEAGAEERLFQSGLDLLRVIVSPARPVVIVIDDLQWAGPTPIGFFDAVLMDDSLPGLLLVGAYREAEVDATHPLSAMLTRWNRLGFAPSLLRLQNLPPADLAALLGEMLRLLPGPAAALAHAVGERTAGNPFDTVELVNALRRDGALQLGDAGWSWEAETLRQYVGEGDVVDLLKSRIERLPVRSQHLLETMACLGGEINIDLLCTAAAVSSDALADQLAPALEDGLLVLEQSSEGDRDGAVRFRHDRVQQAAYARQLPATRPLKHLALARKLTEHAAFAPASAQQYLLAVEHVQDADERRSVAINFRSMAAALNLVNSVAADQFLAAAMRLLIMGDDPENDPVLAALEMDRHGVLYQLGRLQDCDEVYRSIERRRPDPLAFVDSVCVQINSLAIRGQTREAVALGLKALGWIDIAAPPAEEIALDVERGLDALYSWVGQVSETVDVLRPEVGDPRIGAAAKIIDRTMPPSFFCDHMTMAWLVIQAQRLWAEHGPHPALVAPLGHAGVVIVERRQDYQTGSAAVRHVLAISELRGWEPATSQVRFLYSVTVAPWFESVERSVQDAQRAREGLVRGGDLQFACATYYTTTPSLFDCVPALGSYAVELEESLNFAARTGNEHAYASFLAFRQLMRTMRGETARLGGFADASFDETVYLSNLADNLMASAYYHITRALAAVVFGDRTSLVEHAAAAFGLLPYIEAHYLIYQIHLLHALAMSAQVGTTTPHELPLLLADLDSSREWLARRASDAPGNFRHLVHLVDAERAWAMGDFKTALDAFDAALREVANRRRPWQHALIAERCAIFHLDHRLEYMGRRMLAESQVLYSSWGATAKVSEQERQYPFLRHADSAQVHRESEQTDMVSSDSIDLLAVVKASQVLSSETNIDRLPTRVAEILRSMTGATTVRILLRTDDPRGWFLCPDVDDQASVSVEEPGTEVLIPVSAFRYVQRTLEPLLVEDATRDDRFARDPYVAGLDHCSLLGIPISTHGVPRAVVILENRLSHSAFTADRLDSVLLIAGQLAVSLDNALLYASLELKVAERTEALEEANIRLERLSITDPLTGLSNRRQLDRLLDAEWQEGLRSAGPLSIMMIDIDHFKLYNDHYGHLGGDGCLRRVADALSNAIRRTDMIARYGGEEFTILLPNTTISAAHLVAERARAAVIALNEKHQMSASGIVTVSIGIACAIPGTLPTAQQLVEYADAELYEAKLNGRNQVMCADVNDIAIEQEPGFEPKAVEDHNKTGNEARNE